MSLEGIDPRASTIIPERGAELAGLRPDPSPGNALLAPTQKIMDVLRLPQTALWNSRGERLLGPEEGTNPRSDAKIIAAYRSLNDDERLALARRCNNDFATEIRLGRQSPRINLAELSGSSPLGLDSVNINPQAEQDFSAADIPIVGELADGVTAVAKEVRRSVAVTVESLTAFSRIVENLLGL